MSKSKGNVVDPWEVLETYGADAFRWYYLTAQQPWSGYRFSVETLGEATRQFMNTLWNTYSFWVMYANAEGLEPETAPEAPAPGEGTDLDRWILSELERTAEIARRELEGFNCTRAGQEIAAFVETLSNRYVRLSRRRFWEGDAHALGHASPLPARGRADARALHAVRDRRDPPQPLRRRLARSTSPTSRVADGGRRDAELEAGVAAAMRAIELGRAARAAAKMKMRQPLAKAVIVATGAERDEIERLGDIVRAELNVRELEFVTEEAELVSHRVKPNYRTLGPRFGKSMPQVAAAVEGLDPGLGSRGGERRARRSASRSTATSTRSSRTTSSS